MSEDDMNKLFYSYIIHKELMKIEKNPPQKGDRYSVGKYGNAIRYGKFAVVYAVSRYIDEHIEQKYLTEPIVIEQVYKILNEWQKFESDQIVKDTNNMYFIKNKSEDGSVTFENNFDNYYKGKTIDNDLRDYNFYQ